MRIAIVANTSWNILNFRKSLIHALQEEGHEVIIIAPEDHYSEQVKKLAETRLLKNLSRKGTNPVTDLLLVKELKKSYQSLNLDAVVHFTIKPNIYGSFAAKKANIPSIAVVTGLGYTFLSAGIAAKVAKKLYKRAFKANQLTIFQNNDDQNLFIELGLVKEQKSQVISGSGIDTNLFSPREKTDWKTGTHFLFIGRLLYDKGIRELLDAFDTISEQNKETFLHLIGDVDYENPSAFSLEELNTRIERNNQIIYQGRVNQPIQEIANADCVVLPSYREGLPRVMLEALSMAKPVITTDTAGCREVVMNNNGFLAEVRNAEDLAKKMLKFIKLSSREKQEMGIKGRELAMEKFSKTQINQQYLKIIESLSQ